MTVYLTALAAEPTYLPARLGRQLGSLAAKPFNAVSGGNFLIADSETLRRNRTVRPLFARWLVQHAGTFDGEVVLPTRGALFVLRVFFAVAGLVLTVTTLLAVVVVVRRAWLRQHVPTDTAFVIVASCWLAVNGLIAAVHILEPRYLVIQTPLFALMGYLSSVTVLQR